MSYSDQKFYSRRQSIALPALSFGTATASSATGLNLTPTGAVLPKFFRRTAVTGVRARCTVSANAAATAYKLNLLNGTSTFATVTLTTATASGVYDGTVTASNATFAADGQPTFNITGTSTASGDAAGTFEITFETQELYS